jgi:hypothetical protein
MPGMPILIFEDIPSQPIIKQLAIWNGQLVIAKGIAAGH